MSVLELYYPYYENNRPDYVASFPSYSFGTKRSVFRDMQHTIRSLLDSIRVELTQFKDHAGIAFIDASQDWEEPTLRFSPRILHHLDLAFNSEETPLHETCHIFLYLFIATFRELGELLGRFVGFHRFIRGTWLMEFSRVSWIIDSSRQLPYQP